MYLNKTKLFLVISICLIFFFLTYNDVKSQVINIIEGKALVVDGDTIKINGEKEIEVASGGSLLTTLGSQKIFLPSELFKLSISTFLCQCCICLLRCHEFVILVCSYFTSK